MIEDTENQFDFCKNVDIYSILEPNIKTETLVHFAIEHGFRGVCVDQNKIQELQKIMSKIEKSNKVQLEIIPKTIIDYPYGCSTLDIRKYAMLSAKEKGAKEVEVFSPMQNFRDRSVECIQYDLEQCSKYSSELKIGFSYVINSMWMAEETKKKLAKILLNTGVKSCSILVDSPDNSNIIMLLRDIKGKTDIKFKPIFINYPINPEILSNYIKSGIESVGVYWKNAPQIVHGYESIVETE